MKRTTTKRLNEAISNHLLQVIKVESYNKDHHTTDVINGVIRNMNTWERP